MDKGWWYTAFTTEQEPDAFALSVREELEQELVGNFAMGIIEDGEVAKELFYSRGKQVDRNTVFQVASLSKFVSAVGVMKLVEQGKLKLDAPVSTYLTRWQLPESDFDNELVTVRRLLSHTAGLTDDLGYSGFENIEDVQTLEASLNKAIDADPGRNGVTKVGIEPGVEWKYSGGGFTLLQLLVEEVSGETFDAYMKTEVFEPLQMTSSFYQWGEAFEDRLCEFYNADGTKAQHFYYTSLAATSLYTSLADLENFFQIFGENKAKKKFPLSKTSIQEMQQPHGNTMGAAIYGLGTFLYTELENGTHIIGHDGKSTPPINTAMRINPTNGNGIIILTSGNPEISTRIASDWVYLQTGKVDALLFAMQQGRMIQVLVIGLFTILILVISIAFVRGAGK
jgi:CubicO group peptidase (beta-lactamase class C family)